MPLLLLASVIGILALYGVMVLAVGRRTGSPMLIIGLVLTAYWTLAGAIPVILAKWTSSDVQYSYLEQRLFPLRLDGTYLLTIWIYGVFLISSAAVVLVVSRPRGRQQQRRDRRAAAELAHRFVHARAVVLLTFGAVARLVVLLVAVRIQGATSLYAATRLVRSDAAPYLRVYQYLTIVTVYPLALSAGLWITLRESRPRERLSRLVIGTAYFVLSIVPLAENALVGNRAVPLVSIGAIVALFIRLRIQPYHGRRRARSIWRIALAGFSGLFVIGTIGVSRGGHLGSVGAVTGSLLSNSTRVGNVFLQETRSSEKLAAHMSLYGVLEHPDLEPRPLAGSSYGVYTELVDAPSDQVFTVHFVTSWWLRLGPAGVLGAVASFGLAMAILANLAARVGRSRFGMMAALCAGTLPTVGLPVIVVRSGPEALRSVAIELVVLPAVVLSVCARRRQRSTPAPVVETDGEPVLLANAT